MNEEDSDDIEISDEMAEIEFEAYKGEGSGEFRHPESHLDALERPQSPNEEDENVPEVPPRQTAKLPPIPLQPLLLALFLSLASIVCLICGFIEDINKHDPLGGIAFFILAIIVAIPGFYFTYKFYKAYRTKDPQERTRLLIEIRM